MSLVDPPICNIERLRPRRYAGVGSRRTPPNVLNTMYRLGRALAHAGVLLRSGGALGADLAFESGCDTIAGRHKEIFYSDDATTKAMLIASKFHPKFPFLSWYTKGLLGRNAMVLLGEDLDEPVDEVICWTPGAQWKWGDDGGGTGHLLRMAYAFNIRVWNLAFEVHYNRVVGLYL